MFQVHDRDGRPGLGNTSLFSFEMPSIMGGREVFPYSCGTAPDSHRLRLFSPGIRTMGASGVQYSIANSIQPDTGLVNVRQRLPQGDRELRESSGLSANCSWKRALTAPIPPGWCLNLAQFLHHVGEGGRKLKVRDCPGDWGASQIFGQPLSESGMVSFSFFVTPLVQKT